MSIIAAYMVPHPPMIVPAVGRGGEKQVETTIRDSLLKLQEEEKTRNGQNALPEE